MSQLESIGCRDARDSLPAFLDGELPLDERRTVDQHLRSCPTCASERDLLAQMWSDVEQAPRVRASAELWQNIESRLRDDVETAKRRGEKPRWQPSLLYAVAASIGVLLGIHLGNVAMSMATAPPVPLTQAAAPNPVYRSEFFADIPVNTLAATVLDVTSTSPEPRQRSATP